MTGVEIHRIEPFRVRDIAGAIGGIYARAFGYPHDDARAFVNGALMKHVTWPGFILRVAAVEGYAVGFIYGYCTRPGQWWYDTIHPALNDAGIAGWQEGAFELAELAVDPSMQRRGVGSALVRAFLAETRDYPAVLLSAEMDDAGGAPAFYQRFGFTSLIEDFRYPGFDDRIVLMGRKPPQ